MINRLFNIKIFPVWILLVGFAQLYGQSDNGYRFVTYSNKDGFNQNTVISIEQDKTGALWLGTSNGLIKYDGYSFQNVSWDPKHLTDVYHGPISNILSDSRGLLWIVSSSGLNIYNPDRERFLKLTSDSLDMLKRTVEDTDSTMWVIGNRFLSRVSSFHLKDTILLQWSPNLLKDEYTDLDITDFLKIDEELYLLATSTGLFRMSLSEGIGNPLFEPEEVIPAGIVTRLKLQNHMIWVGTRKGLYKTVLDGNKLRYLDIYRHNDSDPSSIANDHIMDLIVGNDNRLWVGTRFGGLSLHNLEDESFTNFSHDPRKKGGISGNMINCLFEDPFNVLWIGTAQAGLSKLDISQKQFTNIQHDPYDEQSIPGNLINNIMEDREGYLWVSTYNLPLCRSTETVGVSNLSTLKFRRFDRWFNSFSADNIVSIFEDKNGYIWLGYENGVVIYDKSNDLFSSLVFEVDGQEIPIRLVRNIKALDNEKILVAGTKIFVLQNPWKYISTRRELKLPVYAYHLFENYREIVSVNIEDPDKVWIGYQKNGLSMFDMSGKSPQLINHYEYNESDETSIINNAVFCISKGRDQSLWIGTFGGGLNRLIDLPGSTYKGFERLRDTIGPADDAFYGIIEENDSILWCATDLGISKLNTRTFEKTNYNMHDGLASNNFRVNAFHKGRSGYYYFGGLNGLTAFKPDQIESNLIPPEIRLTDLMINNEVVPPGERLGNRILLDKHISEVSELILTRDDKTVSFGISVHHTSIPEKNRISYFLEGFDKDWVNISQGSYSPTYTNLPPGNYTFRVRGFNCDGIASVAETSLRITMQAPWYARTWSMLLLAILLSTIIFGISRYFVKLKNLRNKLHFEQLDKERIQEVNRSKLRFFTNISHEFKTPLSLISVPLQKLKEITHTDEQREYVGMIEKNSNRLIRLIDQLLTFRRIEHGRLELKVSKTTMDDFIYPVADAFESLSVKKGIQFYYQVKHPTSSIQLDLEKMEQVLFNLLSNAFKCTPPNGTVRLEGCIRDFDGMKHACFEVTDNGVGIPVKDIDKIFDRFYQSGTELRNMGTGIGLSYSKSIVELHKGIIKVESTPGKRTCFSVLIPLDELQSGDLQYDEIKRLNANELLEYENITGNLIQGKGPYDNRKPLVLLVDDENEFRQIISNVLHQNYRIIEASNGTDALEIAANEEPDLIISDVIMPGINGYDLCKTVKTDIQLCHIPVILLTALEEIDSHIQGMEHGADSYIAKPFNLKFLEVTVQKMIENREKLKAHFTQSHTLPSDVQLSGIDSDFIERVNGAIQENLDDSSFGVEELARETNLSTSQLYRKLKLLTGQIPNAYLRNYRLRVAADLLSKNPGISVKSVMYEVGIESASHFSHAFKKKFGYSPSEFS